MNDDTALRARNRAAFAAMLGHLGRKEFDQFEAYLDDNVFQDWPYRPIPSMADSLVGRGALRGFIEQATADFDPYNYTISRFHEMADPDSLIVEYSSRTVYLPRAVPYANQYLSILRFAEGKIVYWREYVNPLIIKEALLDDFGKTIDERVGRGHGAA
ncbi:nuclear transport factor 2 family protein [Pseudoduganella namucuonensis]|uniref:Ketosteroid isomerase-related protein n=1 Tax=Pseudoduganella namucuonensis TaxID=1035707 RepID=A0A1I7LS69_9BURK|nr:nuclear transport factor 2 family protein [Pseudoduganella namucuonensis]SFV12534.1 Ketosteroid isomerase-related protein [Pseudoduganella namucuonensis]